VKTRWLHRRAHFAKDAYGFVARIDGTDVDITRRKEAEDTLRYISTHDALTGIYNRFSFEKEMHAIDSNNEKDVGLIVCDVDGLKYINDNLGHDAGDILLKQCAEVLESVFCNENEIVSRIGGDEFTVIIKNCIAEELENAVQELRQAVSDYNQNKAVYPLSISIGYAYKGAEDTSMGEIFSQADNLMYAEKPEKRKGIKKLYRTIKVEPVLSKLFHSGK
jgi:diguanylate cyclase (GGDEF)-like protein